MSTCFTFLFFFHSSFNYRTTGCLHLVQVLVQFRKRQFESLSFPGVHDHLPGARLAVHWVTRQHLPVIKDTLRERLSTSILSQVSRESERLIDRQVGLHNEHGRPNDLSLFDNNASPSVQHAINSSHNSLWTLDLHQVHWFQQSWLSREDGRVQASSGSGDDLSAAPVDGIRVQGHVMNVEPDSTQILVTQNGLNKRLGNQLIKQQVQSAHLFRRPLEAGND